MIKINNFSKFADYVTDSVLHSSETPEKSFFDSKKNFVELNKFVHCYTVKEKFLWFKEISCSFFFFKLKRIFLWVALRMYLATAQTFISSIQRKKQLRNFFKSKKLFFSRIAIHKFIYFFKICFESKKILSRCRFPRRMKYCLESLGNE